MSCFQLSTDTHVRVILVGYSIMHMYTNIYDLDP